VANTETSLGLTLVILVTIGGNEIAHLVSPWAALLVMVAACLTVPLSYKRA
jgi:hypothetical protein